MSKKETKKEADASVAGRESEGHSLGADQVQDKMDEETEQGFRGQKVDPTPNENYTVAGVTSNAPTPETDPAAAQRAGSQKFAGLPTEEGKDAGS